MKKLLVVVMFAAMLLAGSAQAIERHFSIVPLANATAPAMLVSAQGGNDHTDLILTNASAVVEQSINLDPCQQPTLKVPPDGALNFHDFASWTCGVEHFKLTALPPDVGALSVVSIGGSTFEVPPLHAVDVDHVSTIGRYPQTALVNEEPIQSSLNHLWYLGAGASFSPPGFNTKGEAQTRAQEVYITTFGDGTVTVTIHIPGLRLTSERYLTQDFRVIGNVSQRKLATKFLTGWIEVTAEDGQVYGLVTVATPTNALSRTYPF